MASQAKIETGNTEPETEMKHCNYPIRTGTGNLDDEETETVDGGREIIRRKN